MDTSLLTSSAFWNDPMPCAAGTFPGIVPDLPELAGHVLFESSGSFGRPKWIALSKVALRLSAAAVNRHLDVTESSCWGLALPPHHVGGFGVAARALEAGCAFHEFRHRWDAVVFGEWLAQNLVTHSSLVPTQVHDLVAASVTAPSALRAIVVGGGHLDAGTGQAARDLGWPVLASYGMTEAGSQIATQGFSMLETVYQSAPIPLLPLWRAEICPDQTLRLAGPALFSGTLVRKNEAWVFNPRFSEWHQTQDRVALANDSLTPLGRADHLVKVLGEIVDPEAIERELAALSNHQLPPGSFAVVAIPDARAQHALIPVFDASLDPDLIAALLTTYARQAPGFRKLQPAVRLEAFPRSPLEKPRRAEILAAIRSSKQPGI